MELILKSNVVASLEIMITTVKSSNLYNIKVKNFADLFIAFPRRQNVRYFRVFFSPSILKESNSERKFIHESF